MFRVVATAALCVVSGCASWRPATPQDRALFRMATSGVAEGATESAPARDVSDVPGAAASEVTAPAAAFTTSVRVVRADGTTVTAPRLTTFAGQRSKIQIVNQTAYVRDFDVEGTGGVFIADPVIAMLNEGLSLDLVALAVAGDPASVAVGLRVTSTSARKPLADRQIRIASVGDDVSIQLPRLETLELASAQRMPLGAEAEWARVPDPSGGADLRILGRVDAVDGATIAEMQQDSLRAAERLLGVRTSAAAPEPPMSADDSALRRLADAAAAGAPQFRLRVRALQMPRGTSDPSAHDVTTVGDFTLRTVRGPGVLVSDHLEESYVAEWERVVRENTGDVSALDPRIGGAVSGLSVAGTTDASLAVRWTVVPEWTAAGFRSQGGERIAWDVPSMATSAAVAAAAGPRVVRPMFNLPGGGTAAIVVDWEPDAGR